MRLSLYTVFSAVSYFLYAVRMAILVYCVMSWFRPRNRFFTWLGSFITPFVRPFRRVSMWITARTGIPLDFSCWFSLIGISLIERALWWIYSLLLRI